MPPPALVDLSKIDLNQVQYTLEDIRQVNPQRFEMEQLSGIIRYVPGENTVVAYRDIREDEFWVRGHIPGRPLFPGVLMIEAAAQMSSFVINKLVTDNRFLGFGGAEDVKFRKAVVPPCRLILVGKGEKVDRRRSVVAAQGFVDGQLVFEGKIVGVFL